ncbi:MAG TPA: preprotein translocase subunit YajC [Phycisphaerae bacterium]|nr:preprotein translocase subunit YajC [Phycisphaerae bacterium]HRW51962.1 preprotein translocase subunit YajC [Phycisphaerae bacterium]
MLTNLMMLAEEAASNGAGNGQQTQASPMSMLPLFLLIGMIVYFVMLRPQRRHDKERAELLASIKKNDRVETAGGIIGTVTSVRDNEITIKVDESSNTKITFVRDAIRKVTPKETGEKDA